MSGNFAMLNEYRIWGHGSFVHICFESPGCRFHEAGYCVMCNYGAGKKLTKNQAVSAFRRAIKSWNAPIKRLLIGTCGSIFDEYEFPSDALMAVIDEIAKTDAESVIFETHYSTVTSDILRKIVSHLPGKQVFIELGFESSNMNTIHNLLRKFMDLDALAKVIDMIREGGAHPILNVFLGAPGLTPKEQLDDALQSVRWAFEHGADEIVVFPANVKPGTELWNAFKGGKYEVPSSWLLVELLNRLTDDEIKCSSISWFGDRQYFGVDTEVVPPTVCRDCRDRLMSFYCDFMKDVDVAARRKSLNQLMEGKNCECREQMLQSLEEEYQCTN